jgi:hypothetical protein
MRRFCICVDLIEVSSVDHVRTSETRESGGAGHSVNWPRPTIFTITQPNAHTFAVSETRHACRCSLVFARASFSYLLVQKAILSPEASAAPARVNLTDDMRARESVAGSTPPVFSLRTISCGLDRSDGAAAVYISGLDRRREASPVE